MADLHAEINGLLEARLRKVLASGEAVNLPEWISQFAESFAELIVFGSSEEDQTRFIAQAREQLDDFIRQKQEMFAKDGGPKPRH